MCNDHRSVKEKFADNVFQKHINPVLLRFLFKMVDYIDDSFKGRVVKACGELVTHYLMHAEVLSMHKHEPIPYKEAYRIIQNQKIISVSPCACRTIRKNCDNPINTCIHFDAAAKYFIEKGVGIAISKKQASELLEMCMENGLIHNAIITGSKLEAICNCCECCCLPVSGTKKGVVHSLKKSNYKAVINLDDCIECGTCEEVCFFDAIVYNNKYIVTNNCMGCGLCTMKCPENAISLIERGIK